MGSPRRSTLIAVALLVIAAAVAGTPLPAAADPPTITDLGTLPGDTDSTVAGINAAGTVIGQSDNGFWYSPTTARAVAWSADGTIRALPNPPGDTEPDSRTVAINNAGAIAGYTYGDGADHAVRWDPDGTATALAGLPGQSRAYPVAIAPDGTVAGMSTTANGTDRPVRWSPDGTITLLDNPYGDPGGRVVAINSSDTIIGYSSANGSSPHPLRWNPDGTATPLSASLSTPLLINDAGVIGGQTASLHGVRLNPDGSTADLGAGAVPYGINAGGTLVGAVWVSIYSKSGAAWAPDGTATALPPLPTDTSSLAQAVNDAGTTVGFSSYFADRFTERTHAASWARDGTVTALGTLPGGTTSAATAINPAGTVAGVSLDSAGHQRAVVWRHGGS